MEELADLAEELMAQRAADRLGETMDVLIEEPVPPEDAPPQDAPLSGNEYYGNGYSGFFTGRAAHQAPEVDGVTTVRATRPLAPGDMVRAVVTGSDGVDLTADVLAPGRR